MDLDEFLRRVQRRPLPERDERGRFVSRQVADPEGKG